MDGYFAALLFSGLMLLLLSTCVKTDPDNESDTVVWKIQSLDEIGGNSVQVWGSPQVKEDASGRYLNFDGEGDGLLVGVNPVEGWQNFTVEILFRPDADGRPEQRFLHFQDELNNRGLIETRVNPDSTWTLDTFLYDHVNDDRLTLLDRSILHPTDRWYWAALVYDGKTMSHYVNGVLELSGEVGFAPMSGGSISIGVRMNQVHWFKGGIREVRFTPRALQEADLQKTVM